MNGSSVAVMHADHLGLTVPDLDAAVAFYTNAFDARELFRMGPFDAADLPRSADGRDWTETHVNVPDARLRFAVLELAPGLRLELFAYERPADVHTNAPRNCDVGGHHVGLRVEDLETATNVLRGRGVTVLQPIVIDEGPMAGTRSAYVVDPWGNHLELVAYAPGAAG
jgi:catechol 2,3-dioxygenase-like lactoylglutathione lyase family enzyme